MTDPTERSLVSEVILPPGGWQPTSLIVCCFGDPHGSACNVVLPVTWLQKSSDSLTFDLLLCSWVPGMSHIPDLDRGSGVNRNTESIALLGGGCTLYHDCLFVVPHLRTEAGVHPPSWSATTICLPPVWARGISCSDRVDHLLLQLRS
ncbi:hypothetical protein DPEC_G00368050 [Dallia pectoralis]|nr:hypothetical protein DPEC_G00368050 [Dallia pectoralis]